jgi:hypothetical protein
MTASSFRAKLLELQQFDRLCSADKMSRSTDRERQGQLSSAFSEWKAVNNRQEHLNFAANGLVMRRAAETLTRERPASAFVGRMRSLPQSVVISAHSNEILALPPNLGQRKPTVSLAECKRQLDALISDDNEKITTAALPARTIATPKTRPATALKSFSRPTSCTREVPTRPCSARSAAILSELKPADFCSAHPKLDTNIMEHRIVVDEAAEIRRKREKQRNDFQKLKADLERLESVTDARLLRSPKSEPTLLEQMDRLGGAGSSLPLDWSKKVTEAFPNLDDDALLLARDNLVADLLGSPERHQRELAQLHRTLVSECAVIHLHQRTNEEIRESSAAVVQRFFRRISRKKRAAKLRFELESKELAEKEDRAATLIQRCFRWNLWKASLNSDVEYV